MTRRLKYEVLEERVVLSVSSPVADTVMAASAVRIANSSRQEPQPVAALPIDQWVHSLVYQQFNQLLPEHVPVSHHAASCVDSGDLLVFADSGRVSRSAFGPAGASAQRAGREAELSHGRNR